MTTTLFLIYSSFSIFLNFLCLSHRHQRQHQMLWYYYGIIFILFWWLNYFFLIKNV